MKHLHLQLYIVLHLYGVNHFKKKKLRNRYDPIGFYKPNLRWKLHVLLNHSCTNLVMKTTDVHFHVSRNYAPRILRNPMRRCFNSKRRTQTLGLTFCHIYIDIPFFFKKQQIANIKTLTSRIPFWITIKLVSQDTYRSGNILQTGVNHLASIQLISLHHSCWTLHAWGSIDDRM